MKIENTKLKIVFFGGPKFSIPAFEALYDAGYELAVITTPPKAAGRAKELRATPLAHCARDKGVAYSEPASLKKHEELTRTLTTLEPDLFVVAAYGVLIPSELLSIPAHGALNIHPSLLPKYRGPTPIQTAILNGDEKTGVTIMQMDEELDHGPVIEQKTVAIKNKAYPELEKELAEEGATLLLNILPEWVTGNRGAKPQNDDKATYTKKFTFIDGKIDWMRSAEEINRKIRALNPEPGTWTRWNGKLLKIRSATAATDDKNEDKPGNVSLDNGAMRIATRNGGVCPTRLQLEGKRPMSVEEFLNGYKNIINSKLL